LNKVDSLEKIFSKLYLRKHFNEASKQRANDMIDDIEVAFKNILRQVIKCPSIAFELSQTKVDWMDEATRTRALIKAAAIKRKIGFPEWILNNNELNAYYEEVR
jgi:predicted metalloendopeptidase